MNIGDVFLRLRADNSGFEKEVQQSASRAGQKSGAAFGQQFGNKFTGDLARLAVGAVGVKGIFDATIGAAIDWESAFAGVEKTVDGTAEELATLESELRGMSRTMPIARGELAMIAEQAGALGIATEDITSFTETVAMIGETTNVSSEMAATALGQLSNVLGLTADDYDNFGAALVDLGNKGASTEEQILEIASRAGAGADLIGIAADATLGWSSAVANLGIEAEAGGSSLQRFFLGAAEHIGAAGDELATMAEIAQMNTGEFTKLFNEDASAALVAFLDGLGDLTQAEQLAVLEMLKFNDVRITRTLLGLAGNTDNLTNSLEVGAEAWEANTALTEEYGKRAKTTAARIEVLGNRIGDLGVRLGESQEGPVDWILSSVELSLKGHEQFFDELGQRGATAFTAPFMDLDMLHALNPALGRMERELPDLMSDTARQSVAAWKEADLAGVVVEDVEKFDNLFARGGPVEAIPQEVQKAMEKAREAAVDGMADIMDAMNNGLRDGKEGYEAAWDDYLEGQEDPFTTAQRTAFIAGQFTGTEFDSGLHSKDPEHVANTVEYVNSQLREFDLLVPGALATGEAVPAALQDGMEAIYPELNAYVEQMTGDSLADLTLDEAQQLGVDGIWLWFQGMQAAEEENKFVAGAIATRAVNQLDISDESYNGGWSTISAWAKGALDYWNTSGAGIFSILAGSAKDYLGGSLPEKGPLAGSVAHDGGWSIGEAWVGGITGAIGSGNDSLTAELSMVQQALKPPKDSSMAEYIARLKRDLAAIAIPENMKYPYYGPDEPYSAPGAWTRRQNLQSMLTRAQGAPKDGSIEAYLARLKRDLAAITAPENMKYPYYGPDEPYGAPGAWTRRQNLQALIDQYEGAATVSNSYNVYLEDRPEIRTLSDIGGELKRLGEMGKLPGSTT